MSFRVWLERFPRQVRALVALLAVLSFVAPTWHVCSLGGHGANCDEGAMEGHALPQKWPVSSSGAAICFCPPEHGDEARPVSDFQFRAQNDHALTCLALMLASMPALFVSAGQLEVVSDVSFRPFQEQRDFASRAFVPTTRGRGPPLQS